MCCERMPDESVHCCVTSPPYFGLRDYGTAEWDVSATESTEIAEKCDHKGEPMRTRAYVNQNCGTGNDVKNSENHQPFKTVCGKCGAVRVDRQIGLEATPAEFVAKMVEVFAEVRRVLRSDGTLWLNLGDSYAGSGRGLNADGSHSADGTDDKQATNRGSLTVGSNLPAGFHENIRQSGGIGRAWVKPPQGHKPKDMLGMPWRTALALQGFAVLPFQSFSHWADELRMARECGDWEAVEIVENKLRHMDLFAGLQTAGWWLRQDIIWSKPNPMPESVTDRCTKAHEYIFLLAKSVRYYYDAEAVKQPVAEVTPRRLAGDIENQKGSYTPDKHDGPMKAVGDVSGRNRRSVWEVSTQPFPEAHFATFPPKLIEPCILAGCPADGVVLDPFAGAGTTLLVAKRHGRKSIGIELNPEYCKLIERRLTHWHRPSPPKIQEMSFEGTLFEGIEN